MLNFDYKKNLNVKRQGIFTKRHHEIVQDLEKMLEKGVPDLTMSQIASNLKISLRTFVALFKLLSEFT